MKKILIIPFLILAFLGKAQIILTYQTHGLIPNYEHYTQYVENVSQGLAGSNQTWDFTNFKCDKIKKTDIVDASETSANNRNPFSNIALVDKDGCFYLNVDELGIEYYGLVTKDAVINFNEPIVKMKYPFTYGDYFEGTFTGEGLYYSEVFSNISGTYSVAGDAYGTLLLPNNVIVKNALRVKTINHTFETACQTTEFYNEKYLWYSADFRMPIMAVVIDKKIVNGDTTTTNTAYYTEAAFVSNSEIANSNVSKYSLNVFPNPFSETATITYSIEKESNVSIEIYNAIGVRVALLVNKKKQVGNHSINFDPHQTSLAVGSYFVRFKIDDKVVMKKIIFVN